MFFDRNQRHGHEYMPMPPEFSLLTTNHSPLTTDNLQLTTDQFMGLIKSQSAPATLAPFSMADIAKQANGILARAQSRADAMLVEAQHAAEEIRTHAHAEGLIAGQREGIAYGLKEGRETGRELALEEQRNDLTAVLNSITVGCAELNARRRELEAGVLQDLAGLALKIASRITKRQGELDPSILERNLAESLKLVIGMHRLRIAIHPHQMATLNDALPRLQLEFPTLDHVELVGDPLIAPGGCRLLTRQGQVDATLDEQLARITADLFPGVIEEQGMAGSTAM